MLVTSFAQFSSSLTSTRLHSQSVLEVNDQGASAMQTITRTLRTAASVNAPSMGVTAGTANVVTTTPGANPTVFSVSNGVLYITEGAGQPVALTNNKVVVSGLTFSNYSRSSAPTILTVRFTLASASTKYPYTLNFEGSGALRK